MRGIIGREEKKTREKEKIGEGKNKIMKSWNK